MAAGSCSGTTPGPAALAAEAGVRLYVFCLMSNHAHLVAQTPEANPGRFMHKVQTACGVHFNEESDGSAECA
jgi:hypothetical protein